MHHKTKSIKNQKGQSMLAMSVLLLICVVPIFVRAQDPGGGPDAPIDGGLSLLIAAGSAYGIKKYRKLKHQSKKK